MYEMIVRDVMAGNYPSYAKSINGEKAWTLYNGYKRMYSHEESKFAVSFYLHNSGSLGETTIVTGQSNVQEIADTLLNHEARVLETKELRDATGKYLSSDEGAWGR